MNRIEIFFAWYDFWIGFYYDRKSKVLYICLLPTLVIKIDCQSYYEIIGRRTGAVIGWCSEEGKKEEEKHEFTFRKISKKKYLDPYHC